MPPKHKPVVDPKPLYWPHLAPLSSPFLTPREAQRLHCSTVASIDGDCCEAQLVCIPYSYILKET